jgi:hypothetical protein
VSLPFSPIEAVARLMADFPHPWWVAGGWAIDLFVGQVTRPHEDLEVGVFREDQGALRRHLVGWELCKAISRPDGGEWVPWEAGEWLALPIHQVRAQRVEWEPPEFEIFLNEVAEGRWQFRRNRSFTRPVEEIYLCAPSGIPIVAPEIQLLYKAKGHREKDEHDIRTALPRFSAGQRDWLRAALTANHPDDPWIDLLDAGRLR